MSMGTELQTAIYTALKTPVEAAGGAVYDEVPELPVGMPDADFPFVEIGDVTAAPFDTDDTTGWEVYVRLHIWSRYRGKAELHDLFQVCYDALNRVTFTLTNYFHFDTLQSGDFAVQRDGDNTTMHGQGRFVFKLQSKT